jgi:hypothetical protein
MEEVYIKDYRRFEEAEKNIAEFSSRRSTTRSGCTLALGICRP